MLCENRGKLYLRVCSSRHDERADAERKSQSLKDMIVSTTQAKRDNKSYTASTAIITVTIPFLLDKSSFDVMCSILSILRQFAQKKIRHAISWQESNIIA